MAIKRIARPKSLTFNKTTTSSAVTISELKSATVEKSRELPEVQNGTALVKQAYQGAAAGSIEIETAQLVNIVGLTVGMKVDTVVLTADAAADSEGVVTGQDATITLSKGHISEIGQPQLTNDSRQPATVKIKITLSNHEGDSSDATIGDWTAVT